MLHVYSCENNLPRCSKDFLRIAAWMPYVVELDFEGQELRDIVEHGYVDKGK